MCCSNYILKKNEITPNHLRIPSNVYPLVIKKKRGGKVAKELHNYKVYVQDEREIKQTVSETDSGS
jgi:hypothetical protein